MRWVWRSGSLIMYQFTVTNGMGPTSKGLTQNAFAGKRCAWWKLIKLNNVLLFALTEYLLVSSCYNNYNYLDVQIGSISC